MSITVELPPDVEDRVRGIHDLDRRIAVFLRGQADLEEWRKRRYSERARRLLEESRGNVDELRNQVSREELFQRFFELHDRITSSSDARLSGRAGYQCRSGLEADGEPCQPKSRTARLMEARRMHAALFGRRAARIRREAVRARLLR